FDTRERGDLRRKVRGVDVGGAVALKRAPSGVEEIDGQAVSGRNARSSWLEDCESCSERVESARARPEKAPGRIGDALTIRKCSKLARRVVLRVDGDRNDRDSLSVLGREFLSCLLEEPGHSWTRHRTAREHEMKEEGTPGERTRREFSPLLVRPLEPTQDLRAAAH